MLNQMQRHLRGRKRLLGKNQREVLVARLETAKKQLLAQEMMVPPKVLKVEVMAHQMQVMRIITRNFLPPRKEASIRCLPMGPMHRAMLKQLITRLQCLGILPCLYLQLT
nr:hypothetical protein Iba_scaffold1457321CG0010 [Ipomoea batatas]